MNILLAGGSCSLINSMILKLRKEGHRVCLLTGDKYRHNKYERVFENDVLFDYCSEYSCITCNAIHIKITAPISPD